MNITDDLVDISIHASVKEATSRKAFRMKHIWNFNSRFREGSDPRKLQAQLLAAFYFNSHLSLFPSPLAGEGLAKQEGEGYAFSVNFQFRVIAPSTFNTANCAGLPLIFNFQLSIFNSPTVCS
jgi:hypothetical protein